MLLVIVLVRPRKLWIEQQRLQIDTGNKYIHYEFQYQKKYLEIFRLQVVYGCK